MREADTTSGPSAVHFLGPRSRIKILDPVERNLGTRGHLPKMYAADPPAPFPLPGAPCSYRPTSHARRFYRY